MGMYYCPRCQEQKDGDYIDSEYFEGDNEIVCRDCLTESESDEAMTPGFEYFKGKSTQETTL